MDTAELQCSAEDKIQMLTKRTDPPVTMTDLVRDTLRLRPDRIIIGEVRAGRRWIYWQGIRAIRAAWRLFTPTALRKA